jgi:ABC-type lipoprotein export system ATPase subunit
LLKVVNIYGPSGSGKTQYIIKNLFTNTNLSKSLLQKNFTEPAVSLLPLADFEGSVEDYLRIFDINQYLTPKFSALTESLIGIRPDTLLTRQYNSFSAGEKRRLDIIRCSLCSDVIIVDEPLSNSNNEYTAQILELLQANFSLIIMLTHQKYDKCYNLHIDHIRYKNGHQNLIKYISQNDYIAVK